MSNWPSEIWLPSSASIVFSSKPSVGQLNYLPNQIADVFWDANIDGFHSVDLIRLKNVWASCGEQIARAVAYCS
jgi:hypothetical protein